MTRPKVRNLKYTVRAPKWSAADLSTIDCLVTFEHSPSEVPFTASAQDSEAHGREIYKRIVSGEFGEIAPFAPPPPRVPLPPEAQDSVTAFWKAPHGEELAGEIARHNEEIASGSSRAIATHAEAQLSLRLATLLLRAGTSQSHVEKMSFFQKIAEAASIGAISAREKAALDILRKIRNEVTHGIAGTFYTEPVRLMVNSLHSHLADYMTYKPTMSIDDKWIDLIFIDAYSTLSMSLSARANPNMHARIVS